MSRISKMFKEDDASGIIAFACGAANLGAIYGYLCAEKTCGGSKCAYNTYDCVMSIPDWFTECALRCFGK